MVKKMTETKSNNISYKLAPYLFIAVAIFTAFGTSDGMWV